VTRKQTQFFVQNQLLSSSRLEELQTLKKLELEREEANQGRFCMNSYSSSSVVEEF
jgi:hypothetical protein